MGPCMRQDPSRKQLIHSGGAEFKERLLIGVGEAPETRNNGALFLHTGQKDVLAVVMGEDEPWLKRQRP